MTGAELPDSTGSTAPGREPTRVGIARRTQPLWLCLAFGILFYAWMFVCLALVSILSNFAVLGWRGPRPEALRSLYGHPPALWLTHHVVILATLGLFLAWLRTRAWARSLVIVTMALSAAILAAFLGMWAAFFRQAGGTDYPLSVAQYPLNVVFAVAISAIVLCLICSAWYAANGSKTALFLFVCLPLLQLAAFLLLAPAGFVTRATELSLPWFYPGTGTFLCIVAGTGFCAWLIRAASRYYGHSDAQAPAYWGLGILTQWVLQVELCAAALSLTPLEVILFSQPPDTRWQSTLIRVLIALEAALVIAVVWAWRRRGTTRTTEL